MFPIAYAYPKAKRAVRDLLRRRLFFVRQMSELSVHLQNTNHQYNINDPLASSRMRSPKYEIDSIPRFPDVGKFISYCRLVKCAHESAGKREKGGYFQIALEYGINPYTLKNGLNHHQRKL